MIDLNTRIHERAHAIGEQAQELNLGLAELTALLSQLPDDQQVQHQRKLIGMLERFSDSVTTAYVVCSVLEVRTREENTASSECSQ